MHNKKFLVSKALTVFTLKKNFSVQIKFFSRDSKVNSLKSDLKAFNFAILFTANLIQRFFSSFKRILKVAKNYFL